MTVKEIINNLRQDPWQNALTEDPMIPDNISDVPEDKEPSVPPAIKQCDDNKWDTDKLCSNPEHKGCGKANPKNVYKKIYTA